MTKSFTHNDVFNIFYIHTFANTDIPAFTNTFTNICMQALFCGSGPSEDQSPTNTYPLSLELIALDTLLEVINLKHSNRGKSFLYVTI